jgi:hypothetical protein
VRGLAERFIRLVTAVKTYHPDGDETTTRCPAMWTLAHRGYSGNRRLDVWAYPTEREATRAGADLALACGLDEDAEGIALYRAGKFKAVLRRYEQWAPADHLLRVQAAFLQLDDYDLDQYAKVTHRRSRRTTRTFT